MVRFRPALALLILTAIFGLCVRSSAQHTIRETPRLAIDSLYGPDLFAFYCAPCHGGDGKGSGPVAVALKSHVSDVTQIAKRNGGTFPKARVENYVTNRSLDPIPAHGTAEMPVWGPIFQSLDPSDARVTVRIANVVAYVESIQAK